MKYHYLTRIILMGFILTLNNLLLKAQTKEETVDWIKKTMTEYGKNVPVKINYDDGTSHQATFNSWFTMVMVVTFCKAEDAPQCMHYQIDKVDDLVRLVKHEGPDFYGFEIYTSGNKVQVSRYTNSDDYAKDGNINMFPIILNWDAEPDLYNRFYKALVHLISYNTQNLPKETF